MMKWWLWISSSSDESRNLQQTAGDDNDGTVLTSRKDRIDLIDLVNFDVQILLKQNLGVQIFEVTDIVTDWMNGSLHRQLLQGGFGGEHASFDSVILLPRDRRRLSVWTDNHHDSSSEHRHIKESMAMIVRQLKQEQSPLPPPKQRYLQVASPSDNAPVGELYTARFKGAALFSRNETQVAVPASVVTAMQRTTLITDGPLLKSLQASSAVGLGSSVIDVRAYINPGTVEGAGSAGTQPTGSNLEVVIIIAIVVACVAFSFLVFAVFWAWRYDRRNREAYMVGKGAGGGDMNANAGSSETTAEDSPRSNKSPQGASAGEYSSSSPHNRRALAAGANSDVVRGVASDRPSYPTVIGGAGVADEGCIYPESVISEDISTSLSQYYRSGMGPIGTGSYTRGSHMDRLNDGGSISSMESYGYSLDGYAPTLATPTPIDALSKCSSAAMDNISSKGQQQQQQQADATLSSDVGRGGTHNPALNSSSSGA